MTETLIVIVTGLLSSILAAELRGWCPAIARWLIRRASSRIPSDSRARYHDEWLAEIDVLEQSDRRFTTVFWGCIVLAGSLKTGRILRRSCMGAGKSAETTVTRFSLAMLIYQVAFVFAILLTAPVLLVRRGRSSFEVLMGRLGKTGSKREGTVLGGASRPVWLHAVSVGEVGIVKVIIKHLPSDLPVLVTTLTPTGYAQARATLQGRAEVSYLPFDLGFPIRSFLRQWNPRSLILVGGDYWPLLCQKVTHWGVPIVVVNGKIGERTFVRMKRLGRATKAMLSSVAFFGVQANDDRDRFCSFGVSEERVEVTGNLGFYSADSANEADLALALESLRNGRPLIVAASTVEGEEEVVLRAFALARRNGQEGLLVLAPRHPERWDRVANLLNSRGFPWLRRSDLLSPGETRVLPSVILLDSLGELPTVYRCSRGVFVGGSLVRAGGQDPRPAARCGRPIVVGPSMENFISVAEALDRLAGWTRVCDAVELGEIWCRWIEDPSADSEKASRAMEIVKLGDVALTQTMSLLDAAGVFDEHRSDREDSIKGPLRPSPRAPL